MKNSHPPYKDGKRHFLSAALQVLMIFVILIVFTSPSGFAQQQQEQPKQIHKVKHPELITVQDTVHKNSPVDEDINKEATRVYMTPINVLKEQQRASSQPKSTAKKEDLNTTLEEINSNEIINKPK